MGIFLNDLGNGFRGFLGGAVGYLGYDCIRWFEPTIAAPPKDELGIPDGEKRAPNVGRSNEGKPGTRKGRLGKESRKGKWGR